jgi:hypothetical protein
VIPDLPENSYYSPLTLKSSWRKLNHLPFYAIKSEYRHPERSEGSGDSWYCTDYVVTPNY